VTSLCFSSAQRHFRALTVPDELEEAFTQQDVNVGLGRPCIVHLHCTVRVPRFPDHFAQGRVIQSKDSGGVTLYAAESPNQQEFLVSACPYRTNGAGR